MKKILLFALLLATSGAFAQSAKKNPPAPKKDYQTWELKFNLPETPAVPPAENPFGLPSVKRQPLPAFLPAAATAPQVRITRGENGLPIWFEGKTEASAITGDVKAGALNYIASLQPAGIAEPLTEFAARSVQTDEQANTHVRFDQIYLGVPVYGGEVIAHTRQGEFERLNGRYFPTPQLASVTPAIDAGRAIETVKQSIGFENVKTNWTAEQMKFMKSEPFQTSLIIYHPDFQPNNERLAWLVEARPNLLTRVIYFIDAQTGEVIHHFDHTCKIDGGRHVESRCSEGDANMPLPVFTAPAPPPVTANGTDLLGVNRSFGAWQQGSIYYLEDAGKSMFNSSASNMPGDPVGAIVTLNALGTSPENQNFDYALVTSNSSTFNNTTAVSAHYNSVKSFDYYKNTFNRNSIDGVGGNILSFFGVTESNGSSMENAYWNGDAMWYGNGGSTFKPLARGLDVGGHEMTHGVVEKTANLIYQSESGALNESFADIFGVMIDRDDWNIGEDVVQSGVSPGNALRNMQDPHNGASSIASPWWQPKHMNEKYNGSDDNGGVHINSGIPNHAFYLFASNASVGKDKAEQVYYKALRDYLVKSSKFVDERIAVLQAANDLYGSAVANVAAAAFDQVGILGSSPGGNYLGQLQANPGDDYILCVSNDYQNLDLAVGNGQVLGTIYDQGLKSRPSVTDDGSQIVFVNTQGHIIPVDMVYTATDIFPTVNQPLSAAPVWRNAAISKDGHFVAAITTTEENYIHVFDLFSGSKEVFRLYNPTYSTGQITGDVQYADVLEFDYSGEYIMYDAFNELSSTQAGDISYWDVGFLQFWENGGFADGENAFISKLFSGLPEKTSIGDPSFAKNSPFVIAFDYINNLNGQNDIYGANSETGDYSLIVSNNGDLGWPNYNRLDNALIYEGPDNGGITNIYTRGLAANKISPSGNESLLIANHNWAVWYADGDRSLVVGTNEPGRHFFNLSVAPNPVTDLARLNIESRAATPARVSIVDMYGKIHQTREVTLEAGENRIDLNMRDLPASAYVIRLFSGSSGAALKVIKR
ncbi:MAG: M4 family metallopeptidase [Lewinellaceae bacterium]|nr:M4 family metallopeptidase [Lewinellaceae bacterium]